MDAELVMQRTHIHQENPF